MGSSLTSKIILIVDMGDILKCSSRSDIILLRKENAGLGRMLMVPDWRLGRMGVIFTS